MCELKSWWGENSREFLVLLGTCTHTHEETLQHSEIISLLLFCGERHTIHSHESSAAQTEKKICERDFFPVRTLFHVFSFYYSFHFAFFPLQMIWIRRKIMSRICMKESSWAIIMGVGECFAGSSNACSREESESIKNKLYRSYLSKWRTHFPSSRARLSLAFSWFSTRVLMLSHVSLMFEVPPLEQDVLHDWIICVVYRKLNLKTYSSAICLAI